MSCQEPHPGSPGGPDSVSIHPVPAEDAYASWPTPTCIVSDGPYGIGGYPGDPSDPVHLPEWYEGHAAAWSEASTAQTTLWFWNTEIGWAMAHPVLVQHGWQYRGCNIWDKGVGHMAGNTNTGTMRKFPPVTEVCAHYIRTPTYTLADGERVCAQDWLRDEWRRSGLPLKEADIACGVRNAASRKYLAADHEWYMPSSEKLRMLAHYANKHGDKAGSPYFASSPSGGFDERCKFTETRSKFVLPFGVTNVWSVPHVPTTERVKARGRIVPAPAAKSR